jgi:hypothetical protein
VVYHNKPVIPNSQQQQQQHMNVINEQSDREVASGDTGRYVDSPLKIKGGASSSSSYLALGGNGSIEDTGGRTKHASVSVVMCGHCLPMFAGRGAVLLGSSKSNREDNYKQSRKKNNNNNNNNNNANTTANTAH